MRIIFLINGVVLSVICVTFFVYEIYIFRKATRERLSTIGRIISSNSTAALAFDNRDDAKEILAALKTEPHIVAACLFDQSGNLFSQYPAKSDSASFPSKPGETGYQFKNAHLEGFEPVMLENKQLGTLFLKTDLGLMYDRFRLYALIVVLVILLSFLLTYLLTKILQKNISAPILSLSNTAKIISDKRDYSVRAVRTGKDELGILTDAFNLMLEQIQEQNHSLNEFNQNLEEKVKQRTVQLESVNKELESFSYSISHDLRAPLRIIDGYADILITDYSGSLDKEGKRVLDIIKGNARRMGQLIDDLLNFSQIGRRDLLIHLADMNKLAKSVISEQLAANGNKVNVKINYLEPVKCDSSLMRQVWINLVSNAIKYSAKKEHPVIEISSVKKETEVVYSIKDNGVGFDMQYAQKLFGVFQRLHKTTEFEGTGIGLALVNSILLKHRGKIWVESEVNKGTTFYFSLPSN